MTVAENKTDLCRMIELEDELAALKRKQGIDEPVPLWIRIGDFLVDRMREPRLVSYKKYLLLAGTVGWFCGAHRFYTGHTLQGILYLLLCWTGIPFAMTIVDILLLLLKYDPDENGMILI